MPRLHLTVLTTRNETLYVYENSFPSLKLKFLAV